MNRRDALGRLAATTALSALPFETLLRFGREARAASIPATLRTLSGQQAASLRQAAELIIPRTDTPGATDAGVTEFIDMLLSDWMNETERDAFVGAVDALDARAEALYGSPFHACESGQQTALMTVLDEEVAARLLADRAAPADEYVEDPEGRPEPTAPAHPYYQIKRFTLLGYFTSRPGMQEALRWSPFPGRWDPCVDLELSS